MSETAEIFIAEPNRSSAIQEIPRILREPAGSLPHSQQLVTCRYADPDESSPHPTSWRPILIVSSIYACVFQVVSFPQVCFKITRAISDLSH